MTEGLQTQNKWVYREMIDEPINFKCHPTMVYVDGKSCYNDTFQCGTLQEVHGCRPTKEEKARI